MSDEWKSQKFRLNVIQEINEMLQTTGQDPSKNASVMENHIFKKSLSKDEYLGLVAKLFMHFKNLAQRRPQQQPSPNAEMGAGMPPNVGQPGNLNQMLNMPPNMPMTQGGQMFPGNRGVVGQQQFLRQSPSPSTAPSPVGLSASVFTRVQRNENLLLASDMSLLATKETNASQSIFRQI